MRGARKAEYKQKELCGAKGMGDERGRRKLTENVQENKKMVWKEMKKIRKAPYDSE